MLAATNKQNQLLEDIKDKQGTNPELEDILRTKREEDHSDFYRGRSGAGEAAAHWWS
jgi:mRNA-degrading endonuclease RelE of RelBE toxin-antitoxin system